MGKKKAVFDADERSTFLKKFTHTHQEKKKLKKKRQAKLERQLKEQRSSGSSAPLPTPKSKPQPKPQPLAQTDKQELVDDRTGETVEVSTTMETNRP